MLYVPLSTTEKQALVDLARREDRDPRYQAARFVREGLIRAGALKESPQNHDRHAD